MAAIVPIVEGISEVEAIPVLFRRILRHQNVQGVWIERPFRIKRYGVVRDRELERAITQAVRDRTNVGGVIVVLDSDDDCPAQLGPALLARARTATDLPVAIVLAQKELECWFLGAKESLRGTRGIRLDSSPPAEPESIRGAKERLSQNMIAHRRYLPVDDQAALAETMDLREAEARCPSFARLVQKLHLLTRTIQSMQDQ